MDLYFNMFNGIISDTKTHVDKWGGQYAMIGNASFHITNSKYWIEILGNRFNQKNTNIRNLRDVLLAMMIFTGKSDINRILILVDAINHDVKIFDEIHPKYEELYEENDNLKKKYKKLHEMWLGMSTSFENLDKMFNLS